MKTTLYLVRHTQTTGNVEKRLTGREDYELTSDGKMFVNKLTKRLEKVRFDVAYSSTSNRTLKTILPLAKLNNLDIIQSENLCEMYFGIYDGWKWEDVNKVNPQIKKNQNTTNEIMGIEGQESTEEVALRMYKEINRIVSENVGKTILIASHGVAIEAFIRKIKNQSFLVDIEENSQKNTSVNIIEYDYELNQYQVILLNDCSHIEMNEKIT